MKLLQVLLEKPVTISGRQTTMVKASEVDSLELDGGIVWITQGDERQFVPVSKVWNGKLQPSGKR